MEVERQDGQRQLEEWHDQAAVVVTKCAWFEVHPDGDAVAEHDYNEQEGEYPKNPPLGGGAQVVLRRDGAVDAVARRQLIFDNLANYPRPTPAPIIFRRRQVVVRLDANRPDARTVVGLLLVNDHAVLPVLARPGSAPFGQDDDVHTTLAVEPV